MRDSGVLLRKFSSSLSGKLEVEVEESGEEEGRLTQVTSRSDDDSTGVHTGEKVFVDTTDDTTGPGHRGLDVEDSELQDDSPGQETHDSGLADLLLQIDRSSWRLATAEFDPSSRVLEKVVLDNDVVGTVV